MDKHAQQRNLRWLKQHAYLGRRYLLLSVVAGSFNALMIVLQAWLLAAMLHGLIIDKQPLEQFYPNLIALAALVPFRALSLWAKEHFGFTAGATIRQHLRRQLLQKIARLGPGYIATRNSGSWTTVLFEQVEKLNDYYSRYLVQMRLVMIIPLAIVLLILPTNWAAVIVFVCTAPLTIVFMALVGMGAADANKRNFMALERLSGHFLDRLTGLSTIRQYDRIEAEASKMDRASELFRVRTMEVLRMAFLSSAVLEFFASISIALIAVYFGFSYLGELNFGHYDRGVTLFSGLLVLFLAPEFFQPFRDLGAYYHAKAEAVGAAEQLQQFMQIDEADDSQRLRPAAATQIAIRADNLVVQSVNGTPLTAPISFVLNSGDSLAVAGVTGAGKSSLVNALMGTLPYQGSLTINGDEVQQLDRAWLLEHLTWLGQNPNLQSTSIRHNLLLAKADADDNQLWQALERAHAAEFVRQLPQQLDYQVGDGSTGLSVGQAQRIALARMLLKPAPLVLLDEPTASLDGASEQAVQQTLAQFAKGRTALIISHRQGQLQQADQRLTLIPAEEPHHG
ncbi:heme ABC transporter permease/ATP-binding protein CydD [Ferrimonas senticii]|uniref:heme ABC transporter permease/ATP-binding protein CydD n=1 Tax=Ferrimonas senticii TaxID=394566 RepID=UPI0003FB63E4|nr:cysteine/glutathione ABC transporter permease/ATP-binding protein CydD [Ferrimonas senticii]